MGKGQVTSPANCKKRPTEGRDLNWRLARTMGLTSQALAKKGPGIFIFTRFPLRRPSNANKSPKQGEPPRSHFPSWGGISVPHILLTLAHPRFKVERVITSLSGDNGKEAMMNALQAPCAHEKGSASRCDRGAHCTQAQYLNEKLVEIQERRGPPPPDPRSGALSARDPKKDSCRQLNVNQKASVERGKALCIRTRKG